MISHSAHVLSRCLTRLANPLRYFIKTTVGGCTSTSRCLRITHSYTRMDAYRISGVRVGSTRNRGGALPLEQQGQLLLQTAVARQKPSRNTLDARRVYVRILGNNTRTSVHARTYVRALLDHHPGARVLGTLPCSRRAVGVESQGAISQ